MFGGGGQGVCVESKGKESPHKTLFMNMPAAHSETNGPLKNLDGAANPRNGEQRGDRERAQCQYVTR